MSESTADVRREIAATRERVSETVAEIDARISEKVDSVKARLDVAQLIRDHPWASLTIALGAGLLVSATGTDARVSKGASAAAKRATRASGDAARTAVRKLRPAGTAAPNEQDYPVVPDSPSLANRLGERLGQLASAPLAAALDRLLDEMRVASRAFGARMQARSTGRAGRRYPVRGEGDGTMASSPADAVPVPSEMLPTEVDARADAVEALGGGTNEPPLTPGAGDLGARWA